VDVPPVVGRCVGRIEAERFHRVDRGKHALDLRPAVEPKQDVAARPDEGQRLERLAAPMARTMSMREMTVPCSPAAQRTKAKMLSGAKPTTLRRRSMICS
jgi:hypothetical protein